MIARPTLLWRLLLALAAAAAAPATLAAQPSAESAVEQSGPLMVRVGQSELIRPPWPVARVSVTDPEVADVEVLTPEQVLLMGRRPGTTDLIMWSEEEQVWRTRVDVGIDLPRLNDDLRDTFVGARLAASQVQNVVVVSGHLRRAEDARQLDEFMGHTGLPWINRTSIAGIQQVQIRVRVAEVSRSALRTLGVNAYFSSNELVGGIAVGTSSGPLQPVSVAPKTIEADISPAVTIFGGLWDRNLQIFVQALAENQYLRVLAEPTLNCLSGEEASFLAGGEFPVPIVQAGGAGGGTSISVEYKPFGVNLRFRPIVLGDNTIRLMVSPEVSDLSDVGAVVIQGLRIPSIRTSRAETTLELKSGQTFALAGLINKRTDARNSRVPGFGDLPIIGTLFRSVRYQQGDTELLIMVTASLVSPDDFVGTPAMPGDLHTPPNDWELYATGRIEGRAAAKLAPADAAWLRERGLDRLRGPGAWASYGAAPAPSTSTIRPVRPLRFEPHVAPAPEPEAVPPSSGDNEGRDARVDPQEQTETEWGFPFRRNPEQRAGG